MKISQKYEVLILNYKSTKINYILILIHEQIQNVSNYNNNMASSNNLFYC